MLMSKNSLVRIQGLNFFRGSRQILSNINLTIKRGTITAIMGPSGSGKSTLLQLITGLMRPPKNTITVYGRDLSSISNRKLYQLRKRMGMLFQSGALFSDLNVYDNVAFSLKEHTNLSPAMIHDLVCLKLEAVGLRNARHLMPGELSGGMARRVALAQAIALDPELMLFDEPFTGQDPIAKGVLVSLIKSFNDANNSTSVLVSHDLEEAFMIADYIYILAEGTIIAAGETNQIKNHKSTIVKQFIKGLPDGPVPFRYPGISFAQDLGLSNSGETHAN